MKKLGTAKRSKPIPIPKSLSKENAEKLTGPTSIPKGWLRDAVKETRKKHPKVRTI